ncbi:hypothetical protein EWF20_10225 [Sulfolobus sp. S-194]|uniref:hypothetical protein n=1 Tax=Sulfolobus sp. S-194 TaxID=2512240 RepID=UPI001436EC95|nr:hypothetical protein [Sulfolobus sp. S-194]QIW24488.1 hypothetical protein EWF20_10225 [Sulfolobus sp. S-194]
MKAKTIAVTFAGVLTGLLWIIPSFFISMITILYILGGTKLFFLFPIVSYIVSEAVTLLLSMILYKFVSRTYAIAFLVTASIISFITPFLAFLMIVLIGAS